MDNFMKSRKNFLIDANGSIVFASPKDQLLGHAEWLKKVCGEGVDVEKVVNGCISPTGHIMLHMGTGYGEVDFDDIGRDTLQFLVALCQGVAKDMPVHVYSGQVAGEPGEPWAPIFDWGLFTVR